MTRPARDEKDKDPGEAALDDTLAATFPASDPLSSDPNPGHLNENERVRNSDEEDPSREDANDQRDGKR